MKRRGKYGLFLLTTEEQRAIAFVVLAVALGLLTKHYRHEHAPRPAPLPEPTAFSTPASSTPARRHRASPAPARPSRATPSPSR